MVQQQRLDDGAAGLIAGRVVEGIQALIVARGGRGTVRVEEGRDEGGGGLPRAGRVEGQEAPHDGAVGMVPDDPGAGLGRGGGDGGDGGVPVLVGDGLVQAGDVVVVVDLELGRGSGLGAGGDGSVGVGLARMDLNLEGRHDSACFYLYDLSFLVEGICRWKEPATKYEIDDGKTSKRILCWLRARIQYVLEVERTTK